MSTDHAAAHNIVITLGSTTFMVPLSISSAVSTKIGHSYGSQNFSKMRDYLWASLAISIGFMSFACLGLVVFPDFLLSLFNADEGILDLGRKMLFIVAIFQVVDGIQITIAGILRGIGVTRPTLIFNLIGYWVLAIPIGLYLAYEYELYGIGMWIGMAIALFLVSIALSITLKRVWNMKGFSIPIFSLPS